MLFYVSTQPKKRLGGIIFYSCCKFEKKYANQDIMKKFRFVFFQCLWTLFLCGAATAQSIVNAVVVAPEGSSAERDIVLGIEKAFSDAEQSVSVQTVNESCSFLNGKKQAKEIAALSPDFVVGYTCALSAVSAQNEYFKAKIPYFAVLAVDPELTALKNRNVFRLSINTEKQFKPFADMLDEQYRGKRFLILKDGDVRANRFAEMLEKTLPEGSFQTLDLPTNHLNQNIKKLEKASDFKADYIIITSLSPKQAVRLVSRVREAGLKTPIIGLNVLKTADFNRMTGSLKHEIYFMDAVGVRHLADTAALIASMRFSGTEPSDTLLLAYAAAQIRMQIPKDKQELNTRNIPFDTIAGPVVFDDFGDMVELPPQALYKWHENAYKIAE